MKKLSPLFKSLSFSLVVILFMNSMAFSKGASLPSAASNCGEWEIEDPNSSDGGSIGVTLLQQAADSDCAAMFILENRTVNLSGAGYALALNKSSGTTNLQFLPSGDPILAPGLNMVIKITPIDKNKLENVNLQGEITLGSFIAVDLSSYILNSDLDLVPLPAECIIPNDQIYSILLKASPILETAGRSAFKGDLIGSRSELSSVVPAFFEKVGNYAREMGVGCFADYLKSSTEKPGVISKIILSYVTWVPVFIFDYFKFQGMVGSIDLSYVPRTLPTSRPTSTSVIISTLTPTVFPTPTVTVPPVTERPTLSSPGNGSEWPGSSYITLAWNPVPNAAEYQVVIWGGAYNTVTPCQWQIGTSCDIGQMLPGKVYWRVQARDSNGQKTDWSDTWSFTIFNN